MHDAIKKGKVVFQLGHHARQSTAALQAKELIAQGILGPSTLVRAGRFMSSDSVQVVKEMKWDLWPGPAPKIPWNEGHFTRAA